ncbi:hypothetical protein [Novipirellula artificiosorum]|uniref:Dilute domain-containing protein n=1 Tax=Novipirellula artificiosorum TaxID=2528016 RepID=A0A5C6DMR4_9BACT|nr:hypothetical protein [Novipirellula artificiosorum]TWU37147.1 hypothetical protein Poly41_32740 [Novipirellula artificiosorum]
MKTISCFLLFILSMQFPFSTTAQDLEVLRKEFLELKFGMFIYFNMGTFHEKEWVEPGQDPLSFNPSKLDVAPNRDGLIDENVVQRLQEVGEALSLL